MFALARKARLMYAQCLAMGPDFVPATQMSEHVVFDMGELKTKIYTCDRSTDSNTSDVIEMCVVSDVHHKILGLRKTVFSAAEAKAAEKLAVQQAAAISNIVASIESS